MDPVVIVALATAITSMLVSILTHIRYSKCGFFEIETRDTDHHTPVKIHTETDPLLNSSPPHPHSHP